MLLASNLIKKIAGCFLVNILLIILISLSVQADSQDYQPYNLIAGSINLDYQQGKVYASDEVVFKTEDLMIKSDKIVIDLNSKQVEASGDGLLIKTGTREINGTYVTYNYGSGTGQINGAETKINELSFHSGEIKILKGEEKDIDMKEAAFTPCILPDPHYQYKARKIEVYPDNKIIARDVEFWFGHLKLFTLPNYVVEYRKTENGYELYNPTPLPRLSYNSVDGLSLEYYYPYQLGNKGKGKINIDYNQSGDRSIIMNNSYQINPGFDLTNKLSYIRDVEDPEDNDSDVEEDITGNIGTSYQITPELFWINQLNYSKEIKNDNITTNENILSTGLNYKKKNINLLTTAGYDLINHKRKEKIKLGYSPFSNYKLDIYQDYTDEELVKNSYALGYHGKPIRWRLTQREGYDVDYLPYLSLTFPSYQLLGFSFNTTAGVGRAANEGVVVDMVKGTLTVKKSIEVTPDFNLSLTGGFIDNIYSAPKQESYQVYQGGVKGNYSHVISPTVSLTSSLGYKIKEDRGNAILPDDEIDSEQILSSGLDITYLTEEPESAWVFGVDGSYSIDEQDWDTIKLSLTRKHDCYSFSVDYDLIDNSFGFSFGT